MKNACVGIMFALLVQPAFGVELPIRGLLTAETTEISDNYRMPAGAWSQGQIHYQDIKGSVTKRAWHMPGDLASVSAIISPLRDRLTDAGWQVLFECKDQACGGFDFRFSVDILPAPAMFVDIGDFRYLVATDGANNFVSLFVSRARDGGYVQITQAGEDQQVAPIVTISTKSPTSAAFSTPFLNALLNEGHVALDDVAFLPGSSTLEVDSASLSDLSSWLIANPDRRVTFVGHTDADGSLNGNISLSQKRADSVRNHMISKYGVAQSQVTAHGVGFLAPRAENDTEAGRNANRRVEVVLLRD